MGAADWIYDHELQIHVACCTYALPNGKRCGNGPLTGNEIATGVCSDTKRHSGSVVQTVTLPRSLTCAVDMGPATHSNDFWKDDGTNFVVCGRHKGQYDKRPDLGPFDWHQI